MMTGVCFRKGLVDSFIVFRFALNDVGDGVWMSVSLLQVASCRLPPCRQPVGKRRLTQPSRVRRKHGMQAPPPFRKGATPGHADAGGRTRKHPYAAVRSRTLDYAGCQWL